MNTNSKRNALSIKKKIEIVQDLSEPGATQSSVSVKYGVPRSSVTKIWKNKDEILNLFHNDEKLNLKRTRSANYIEVDEALFEWFKQKGPQGARISGPILIAKATQIASADGREFTPTPSWLQRWRSRHNIVWKKEEGEKQDADTRAASEWVEVMLPYFLGQFTPQNIFNADETGLYFRGFPERGYGMKSDKLFGGKKAKDRLTVLVCANMTGDEKMPILVIGKSKKPRCFPKDPSKLPVLYRHSTNAWMTSDLFREWLDMWDQQLSLNQRKILLLVDNCPAHPNTSTTIANITLHFLPPNTTSLIQPMDMGVIRNLKGFYRNKLNSRIITALDADENLTALGVSRSVNVLDALYLLRDAWLSVKTETIRNCYSKGGFKIVDEIIGVNREDDVPVPEGMTLEDFQDTIEMDANLEVAGELDDEALLDLVRSKRHQLIGSDSDSDSDDLEITEIPSNEEPTLKKVLEAFNLIRGYAQKQGENDIISLDKLEAKLRVEISQAKKQSTIVDFLPQLSN